MVDAQHAKTTAGQFAADNIEPFAAEWERSRRFPREAVGAAARVGLLGLLVPRRLGGLGLGVGDMAEVMRLLAAADMGLAFSLVCHNNLAGAIAARGGPYHHHEHLPGLLDGSTLGGFLLTEPTVGSDATAIRTRAERTADGWVINGDKAWATNGTDAGLVNVYVQTEPGRGARGIAAFLVDTSTPGVERGPAYEMLAAHSTGTASFRFNDVVVGEAQLFIQPGEAFAAAMEAIDIARLMVSQMCIGMLDRALTMAVAYLSERHAFGKPLAEQQGLQWMLADVATDLEAARGLAARAASAIEGGERDRAVYAAHAKKFATRVAMAGLSQCMQALGANGFRHDRPLARHLASAKMAQYLDGTTEVQNIVISRALFGVRD
ncbi:MAG: acyl-CoA dehydrogenase family protein [Pseudomonadota bacterium]